jgi:hypothetical protein
MKIIRAKLAETPTTCKCGGKIIKAIVRKQEQAKCAKCGERVSGLYEERIGSIKRLVEQNGKDPILFVIEDGNKKVSKKSTELAGETLELGDKLLIVIDKNGHCKVEEIKKTEGFRNIKNWKQFNENYIAFDEEIERELEKLFDTYGAPFNIPTAADRVEQLMNIHSKWLDVARKNYDAEEIAKMLFKYELNLRK